MSIDWKSITVSDLLKSVGAFVRLLDRLCPADDPAGPLWLMRSLAAVAGLTSVNVTYIFLEWARSGSLSSVQEFFQRFPTEGFLAILFVLVMLSVIIGHNPGRSYCQCFALAIKWNASFITICLVCAGDNVMSLRHSKSFSRTVLVALCGLVGLVISPAAVGESTYKQAVYSWRPIKPVFSSALKVGDCKKASGEAVPSPVTIKVGQSYLLEPYTNWEKAKWGIDLVWYPHPCGGETNL